MALVILGASKQFQNIETLTQYIIMGELSLDGQVRPIKDALPTAIQARKEGFKGLIVPSVNAKEAGMVNDLSVFGVAHINEVIVFFENHEKGETVTMYGDKYSIFTCLLQPNQLR